jgi:hypothetical protein
MDGCGLPAAKCFQPGEMTMHERHGGFVRQIGRIDRQERVERGVERSDRLMQSRGAHQVHLLIERDAEKPSGRR